MSVVLFHFLCRDAPSPQDVCVCYGGFYGALTEHMSYAIEDTSQSLYYVEIYSHMKKARLVPNADCLRTCINQKYRFSSRFLLFPNETSTLSSDYRGRVLIPEVV